jgi:hypothetical protein
MKQTLDDEIVVSCRLNTAVAAVRRPSLLAEPSGNSNFKVRVNQANPNPRELGLCRLRVKAHDSTYDENIYVCTIINSHNIGNCYRDTSSDLKTRPERCSWWILSVASGAGVTQ